jgi:hypothetical protein
LTSGPSRRGRDRGRRTGHGRLARVALLLVVGAVIFGLGVGLGQALRDSETPAGSRTQLRTLKPLPLAPARETVTVTVSAP